MTKTIEVDCVTVNSCNLTSEATLCPLRRPFLSRLSQHVSTEEWRAVTESPVRTYWLVNPKEST
jgi:hypothetical protein